MPERDPQNSTADDRAREASPRKRLEFQYDGLADPFDELFDADVTINVDSVVRLEDRGHVQYWTVTYPQAEPLVRTVEQFPTTESVRLVRTGGETHRLEVYGTDESVFTVVGEYGGVTRSAVYDGERVRLVGEFAIDVETDAVVAAIQDVYPDIELAESYTVETVSAFRHLISRRLTQRQRTVLQMAYFGGYYEQPRGSTGEELAERLDISKQAFHEHLRKAYAIVFEDLIENGIEFGEVDM